jgi:tetratricopeptide (TPR) repeat protein
MFVPLLSCVIMLFVSACGRHSTVSADRLVDQLESTSSPREIRDPSALTPLTRGADLFEHVRVHPDDRSARQELSEVYAARRFAVASRFFQQSINIIQGNSVVWGESVPTMLWVCGEDDRSHADEWQAQIMRGSWRAVATELRPKLDNSCVMRLAWAQAAMLSAEQSLQAISAEDRELAVRTWITLIEEGNALPSGTPDLASAYIFLGQYFSAIGDLESSLTAYRIARLYAPRAVINADEAVKEIDDHIARVEAARKRTSGAGHIHSRG